MDNPIKTYLGVVEDIQDPLKQGRARIRVVSIHDDIPTDALPWAYPKQKSAFFDDLCTKDLNELELNLA